jgi:pimeloyl-ACP methyl ester carboxylesterase
VAFAGLAQRLGLAFTAPDQSPLKDPRSRLDDVMGRCPPDQDTILVGSSMGGYVSALLAGAHPVAGLFLLAPAVHMGRPGYEETPGTPQAPVRWVVHGMNDDVVPYGNAVRWAVETRSTLVLLDSGHRLDDVIPQVERLFCSFLEDVRATPRTG